MSRFSIERTNTFCLLFTLVTIFVFFSWRKLIGLSFTGWDTHNLALANFIYFSDALKSGFIPLWNPFVQSGVLFPTINNIGFFSPFLIPFEFAAFYISPIIVFEWLILFVTVFGGIGMYFFLRERKIDYDFSVFGSVVFCCSTLIPNAGQLGFIFALASLPWLLFASHFIIKTKLKPVFLALFGLLFGFLMASGYPWMNFVNNLIFLAYIIIVLKVNDFNSIKKLSFFLVPMVITYVTFLVPTFMTISFIHENMLGDLVPNDPVLRGMNKHDLKYSFTSILQLKFKVSALFTSIKILINPLLLKVPFVGWNIGVGLVTLFLLITALMKKRILEKNYFWIGLFVIGVLYSCAVQPVKYLSEVTPFLNSNRFLFLGLDYSVLSLIVLATQASQDSYGKGKFVFSNLFVLAFVLLTLAISYISSPIFGDWIYLFFFIATTSVLFFRLRVYIIFILIIFVVIETFSIIHLWSGNQEYGLSQVTDDDYFRQVNNRNRQTVYESNTREVSKDRFYKLNDMRWSLNKTPFSGGYDNLGSPVYWHFKNSSMVSKIFTIDHQVRVEDHVIRSDKKTDNEYVAAVVSSIQRSSIPISNKALPISINYSEHPDSIYKTILTPNTAHAEILLSNASILTFVSNYAPGWNVYVDGKKQTLLKINHLFMGVFIQGAGLHSVDFKFTPYLMILCLLTPYFLLLIFTVLIFRTYMFSGLYKND